MPAVLSSDTEKAIAVPRANAGEHCGPLSVACAAFAQWANASNAAGHRCGLDSRRRLRLTSAEEVRSLTAGVRAVRCCGQSPHPYGLGYAAVDGFRLRRVRAADSMPIRNRPAPHLFDPIDAAGLNDLLACGPVPVAVVSAMNHGIQGHALRSTDESDRRAARVAVHG